MRTSVGIVLLPSLLLVGTGAAQQPVPVGNEVQVNTYTTGTQYKPSVAVDPGGNYVVVWIDAAGGYDVHGQRYAQDGTPMGGEFPVNSGTASDMWSVSVAADGDGNFVVVWAEDSYPDIYGRRFGSDGAPIGNDFQINTYTTGYQRSPSVAVESDGDFVVVWHSDGSSGSDPDARNIQGQRYASDGTILGGEFQVNTYTTNSQGSPSVGVDSDGDFVVVWAKSGSGPSDPDSSSIQAQRYASDGTTLGGEFQVNSYDKSWQATPAVAVDSDGDFVVVWESDGSSGTDTESRSIQGQRYASDGTPLGGEFQVNTYTTNYQNNPSLAVDSDGDFVVVWVSNGSSGSDTAFRSIQGQRYASDGTASGEEFQVNTYTTSWQASPAVAIAPTEDFLAVWASRGSSGGDTSGYSVQGQWFVITLVDLSISKDDAVTQATPGLSVTYTIVASNNTPTDVASASVTDSFPAELTCSWTSVAMGGATGNSSSSGDLNDVLNMPAGSSVIYTVTCAIDSAATGTLSNTATIWSAFTDPNPADNSATDDDTVLVPEADLAVTQTDVPDPVRVNDSLAYTINVSNEGPSLEPQVLVTDVLPPEVSFGGVDATGWLCNHVSGGVSCTRSSLDVGSAPAITVTVHAPAYETVLTNNAGVGGGKIDPDSGNNSSAETTTVLEGFIFIDGFESGDTSAWSGRLP